MDTTRHDGWFQHTTLGYSEPVLCSSFSQLNRDALAQGNEVVTDPGKLMIEDYSLDVQGGQESIHAGNVRPLGALASQMVPGAMGAIDVTTGEFLVYAGK